ncbi:MAG: RsmD family RNA methyltransferase [Candidatus Egerieousia sp.]
MRIIGGTLRGRVVNPPAGYEARPTTDFAKEGLFNTLQNEFDFEECILLDLFGGTGSISAEFVSRGGLGGECVEMNKKNALFIRKMHASLGIRCVKTIHCNVFDFIDLCSKQYDLIFADPPYRLQGLEGLPDKILGRTFKDGDSEKHILADNGYLILEHGGEYNFSEHPNFVREKKYGNVHFSFFELK